MPSFTKSTNPDRLRKYGEIMQLQGQQTPTEIISGVAVKKSPLEMLAKGLQSGMGSYYMTKADRLEDEQKAEKEKAMQNFLFGVGGDMQGADPNIAALYGVDPEMALKYKVDVMKPTDTMKEAGWMGISPQEIADMKRQDAYAGAIKEGMAFGGFDQYGRPIANPVVMGTSQPNPPLNAGQDQGFDPVAANNQAAAAQAAAMGLPDMPNTTPNFGEQPQTLGQYRSESEARKALEAQKQQNLSDIYKTRLDTLNENAQAIQGQLETFNQIESLINQGTLGNSPADRAAMIAHNMGLNQSPETIRTSNLMKLGNQLVLSRGSLGTGVSTADAERYDKAAGDFSKAQSNQERLGYINVMREIASKYAKQANEQINQYRQTGALPDYVESIQNQGMQSQDMSPSETRTIGGKTYVNVNGQWYEQ